MDIVIGKADDKIYGNYLPHFLSIRHFPFLFSIRFYDSHDLSSLAVFFSSLCIFLQTRERTAGIYTYEQTVINRELITIQTCGHEQGHLLRNVYVGDHMAAPTAPTALGGSWDGEQGGQQGGRVLSGG
jgi:hypothetical protein